MNSGSYGQMKSSLKWPIINQHADAILSIRASYESIRWGLWKEFYVTSPGTHVPWMWQKADKKGTKNFVT